MAKNTQNNPVVREDEFHQAIGTLAEIITEALRRTEALAEVTAGIALILRENGLVDVPVEAHDDDTGSLDLNAIAAVGAAEDIEPAEDDFIPEIDCDGECGEKCPGDAGCPALERPNELPPRA